MMLRFQPVSRPNMTVINDLLQPISEASPTGEDLVFSAEFDIIREERRQDDPHLDQGEWVIDRKEADWPLVQRLTTELLMSRSKDLRLAGWLTEAWAKLRGFEGLRDGLRITEGLCRKYWHTVHPMADDGDLALRVGNLSWLLDRSRQLMRELPLTQSEGGRYGAAMWDSASQLANAVRRNPGNANELTQGKLTLDQFDAARRDTPPAFYSSLEINLEECAQALAALEQTVNAALGDEGPAFSGARDGLSAVTELARRFAREAGLVPRSDAQREAAATTSGLDGMGSVQLGGGAANAARTERVEPTVVLPAPETAAGAAAVMPAPAVPAGLQTRDQALAQLREVADFFRRTEPHSPVAYLADKAASWGEMSLHLWLRTVLKNEETLAGVEELLGVPGKNEGS